MTFGGENPYGPAWQPNGGPAFPYGGPAFPYEEPRPLWQRFREGDWPPLLEILRRLPVHGCAWAAILFCLWPLLLPVLAYPLARSARRQAHLRFPPHTYRRILDPQLMRVQKVRAVAALLASFLILVVYGSETDLAEIQGQYVLRLAVTPWLLLLTAPVVIMVLVRLAPEAARPGMRTRLRPAVRTALWYFAAFTAVPLLFAGMALLGRQFQAYVFSPFLTIALLAPVLWMLFFVCFASTTLIPTAFGTSEVHAALPALLTGVLVWELAVFNLAMTGTPPGPPFIQILAVIGGPASVSAVAWWEIGRLRARYGVTLRGSR
ncbi:hypothetical protein ACGFYU_24440 [Streptomyces sp. NPDC048337]|uniref:hypothetical protein n=1 Tax=Streptomyces sp. NPDC048337 TaxID=3365535 RepID=UPI003715D8DE